MDVWHTSLTGERHLKQNKSCQDSYMDCKTRDGYLLVAIADGVSSSYGSEYASQRAVEAICAFWQNFSCAFSSEESLICAMRASFNYALSQVDQLKNDSQAYAYETTLEAALFVSPSLIIVGHAGDGGCWVKDTPEAYRTIFQQQRDAVDGSVYTLSSGPEYWRFDAITTPVEALTLVTDGVHDALLNSEKQYQMLEKITQIDVEHHNGDSVRYYYEKLFAKWKKDRTAVIDDDITVVNIWTGLTLPAAGLENTHIHEYQDNPPKNKRSILKVAIILCCCFAIVASAYLMVSNHNVPWICEFIHSHTDEEQNGSADILEPDMQNVSLPDVSTTTDLQK